jgi:hypothetical protein
MNSLPVQADKAVEEAARPEADRRMALLAPLEILLRPRGATQAAIVPPGQAWRMSMLPRPVFDEMDVD